MRETVDREYKSLRRRRRNAIIPCVPNRRPEIKESEKGGREEGRAFLWHLSKTSGIVSSDSVVALIDIIKSEIRRDDVKRTDIDHSRTSIVHRAYITYYHLSHRPLRTSDRRGERWEYGVPIGRCLSRRLRLGVASPECCSTSVYRERES